MTLLLRLEAPMMSFGAPMTSGIGPSYAMPTLSMLTGLCGNALGFEHREVDKLNALQRSLCFGARQERRGARMVDYQTVDLGQSFLQKSGWTTRGVREDRQGASSNGTHIRPREYIADASFLVALALEGSTELGISEAELGEAFRRPRRPLFLGRKACIPSTPLLEATAASGIWETLATYPAALHADEGPLPTWGPQQGAPENHELLALQDIRGWDVGVHLGHRYVAYTTTNPPRATEAA